MENLTACVILNKQILDTNQELGKKENGSFFGKKVMISYDAKEGWEFKELNWGELFLRKVFGFYRSTHLDTVLNEYSINTESKSIHSKSEIHLLKDFDHKIREIWAKAHNSTPLPEKEWFSEQPDPSIDFKGKICEIVSQVYNYFTSPPKENYSEQHANLESSLAQAQENFPNKVAASSPQTNTAQEAPPLPKMNVGIIKANATFHTNKAYHLPPNNFKLAHKKQHDNLNNFDTKRPNADLQAKVHPKNVDLGALKVKILPEINLVANKIDQQNIPNIPNILKKKISEYKSVRETNFILTVEKVKRQNELVTKHYKRDGLLGKGGTAFVYRYKPVDAIGNPVMGKDKAIKVGQSSNDTNIAMKGYNIMKDQYVNPQGAPVNVPGLIKRTKFMDVSKNLTILSLYNDGDAAVKTPRLPKSINECFNFAAHTCFGLRHLHSTIAGKASIAHSDIKPANIFCSKDNNGVISYGLADFDGAHRSEVNDFKITTKGYLNENDGKIMDNRNLKREDITEFSKSVDIYSLGVSWRHFFSQLKIEDFYPRINYFSRGTTLKGPMDKSELVPSFYGSLSNEDRLKMDGLMTLTNEMTVNDWTKRPNAEICLSRLEALGLNIPVYPVA